MATIDHPLTEAARRLEADPAAARRARDEWFAGPRTTARLREAIFETIGEGFRGCLPVAIEEVMDPEAAEWSMGVAAWLVVGIVDDSSVLELSDGTWFGGAKPGPEADRAVVVFRLDGKKEASALRRVLRKGRHPVWAVPATRCIEMGGERDFRAAMAAGG
ncbi:MAG: hypothetical protein M3Q66_02405 [Chloroflexota bacterium]|nr:hypothetical protein [Chloroflexota bacterium]